MTELERLLSELTDPDSETDNVSSRLAELIKNDPVAQEAVVDHLCLDMLLTNSLGGQNVSTVVDVLSDAEPQGALTQEQESSGESKSVSRQGLEPTVLSGRLLDNDSRQAGKQDRLHFRVMVVLVSGVLVALIANAAFLWRRQVPDRIKLVDSIPLAPSRQNGLAVLSRAVNVAWQTGNHPNHRRAPVEGSVLSESRLKIDSGILQIEFFNGVSLVIEGPAEFEIQSSDSVVCHYGKLRAYVPVQARAFQIRHAQTHAINSPNPNGSGNSNGFTVRSPRSQVIALNSEFGLDVSQAGVSQLHVFDGEIRLVASDTSHDSEAVQHELSTGHGIRLDSPESVTRIISDSSAFPNLDDLAARVSVQQDTRYHQWLEFTQRLKYDSRVLLYFDFENAVQGQRVLPDRSQLATTNAAIVGCEWTTGRWPMKRALDFKRDSDRLAMKSLQGTFPELTFSAWIRVDSLQVGHSALLMTNDYGAGNPHWQITSRGSLELGVGHDDSQIQQANKYISPQIVNADRFGRWMHVATVYDSRSQTVKHFVNGVAVSSHDMVARQSLEFSNAEIGNWLVPRQGGREPIRNFNGRMDELTLFKVALTNAEIHELHKAGKR
jgi:hypothetical protein